VKGWSEPKTASPPSISCVFVDNQLVKESRAFILLHHVSVDDALHLYTSYAKECDYFVIRDRKLKQIGGKLNGMKLVNVAVHQEVVELFSDLDSY
jgi:hypothetical protein